MKDPWTDIHDRMNNFELPEPDGLWEGIENRLDYISPAPRRRWQMLKVARRVLDIAAAIALLLMLFNLSLPEADLTDCISEATDTHTDPDNPVRVNEIAAAPDSVFVTQVPVSSGKMLAATSSLRRASADKYSTAENLVNAQVATVADSTAKPEIATPGEDTPPLIVNPSYRQENARSGSHRTTHDRATGRTKQKVGGLRFNLFTNGTLAAAQQPAGSRGGNIYAPIGSSNVPAGSGVRPMNFPIPADPLVPSQLYGLTDSDKDHLYRDLHHHQPVRVGLTVSYPISQHFAVETGLSYSYLRSEMKDGTDVNFTAAKQELHYLGIPVNLKWRAMSIDRVHLYMSAGGMGEKNISGRISERLVIENKENQTNTEKRHIKQLQWSANAAVGVECELTPLVGLYAEPGVSYFFDDGSKVSTIYKDKPWNFNIQIGVRLNLGQ